LLVPLLPRRSSYQGGFGGLFTRADKAENKSHAARLLFSRAFSSDGLFRTSCHPTLAARPGWRVRWV